HTSTVDVRFAELDPYGHVNHAVYITYFEVARTEALAACEIPIHLMAERGVQIVVTGLEVRYRRAAVAGDRLTVETSLSELRRASGTWRQRILRDGEELVTALVTAGVTDRDGRPTRPPDWLFPALQPLLD
ncbi:MAG: thioesterase family protein, partial [Actinomycetota bacterium]